LRHRENSCNKKAARRRLLVKVPGAAQSRSCLIKTWTYRLASRE
jgi:hypothetical protein